MGFFDWLFNKIILLFYGKDRVKQEVAKIERSRIDAISAMRSVVGDYRNDWESLRLHPVIKDDLKARIQNYLYLYGNHGFMHVIEAVGVEITDKIVGEIYRDHRNCSCDYCEPHTTFEESCTDGRGNYLPEYDPYPYFDCCEIKPCSDLFIESVKQYNPKNISFSL